MTNNVLRQLITRASIRKMITAALSTVILTAAVKSSMLNAPALGDLDHGANIKVMRVIDGKLYVGGVFERANRKLANNIAVWDGTAWGTLGKGVDGRVYDICAVKGSIYVCGDFSYVNKGKQDEGTPATRIAKWDGAKWSSLAERPVDREIFSLATDGTNLYLGGNFTKINDATETRCVAKYDGKKITAIEGKFDRAILSMVWMNGKLYAGGVFNEYEDDACAHVAVYDGKAWSEVGGGLSGTVQCLASDGKNLYAAGGFSAGGKSGVAMFDGSKWNGVADASAAEWVHCEGGKVYIAGDFNSVNGKNTHNVAILEGGKVVNTLNEVIYSHHRAVLPFGGAIVIGGNYADTQVAELGGFLKWTGVPGIDKLEVLSSGQ
jgi:hypothetical protein